MGKVYSIRGMYHLMKAIRVAINSKPELAKQGKNKQRRKLSKKQTILVIPFVSTSQRLHQKYMLRYKAQSVP